VTSLWVGAVLAGLGAAFFLSIFGFLLLMFAGAISGAIISLAIGSSLWDAVLTGVACMVLMQVGYAAGVLCRAFTIILRRPQSRNNIGSTIRAVISGKRAD
jgi:uncharacterized membrane protein